MSNFYFEGSVINGLTACPAICGGLRLTINNLYTANFFLELQDDLIRNGQTETVRPESLKAARWRPPVIAGQTVR